MGWVNTEKLEWLRDDLRDMVGRGERNPRSEWTDEKVEAFLHSFDPEAAAKDPWPVHLMGLVGGWFAGGLVLAMGLGLLEGGGMVEGVNFGSPGFMLGAGVVGGLLWWCLNLIWKRQAEKAQAMLEEAQDLAARVRLLPPQMSDTRSED